MTNIVFIKDASYADVGRALRQWIDLYTDNLAPLFTFSLYEDPAGHVIVIKADEKLSNEYFAFLVNYLKYPEGITYKVQINGYTEITKEKFFPGNLSGNKIMLFMPDSDTEYDNVYWATMDNQVYKTDVGGKTSKSDLKEIYERPALNFELLPAPEILQISSNGRKTNQENRSEDEPGKNIAARFKVLVIIIAVLLAIHFFYRLVDSDFSFKLYSFLVVGITTWFLTDYKMLQVVKYFNLSFIIAALLIFYGYFFVLPGRLHYVYPRNPGFTDFSLFPLLFLSIQKPIRLLFKAFMKREPVIEKSMPGLADFFYFLSLPAFTVLAFIFIEQIVK